MSDQNNASSSSTPSVSPRPHHAISSYCLTPARSASGSVEAAKGEAEGGGTSGEKRKGTLRAAPRALVARREIRKVRICRGLAVQCTRATVKYCRAPSRGIGVSALRIPPKTFALLHNFGANDPPTAGREGVKRVESG